MFVISIANVIRIFCNQIWISGRGKCLRGKAEKDGRWDWLPAILNLDQHDDEELICTAWRSTEWYPWDDITFICPPDKERMKWGGEGGWVGLEQTRMGRTQAGGRLENLTSSSGDENPSVVEKHLLGGDCLGCWSLPYALPSWRNPCKRVSLLL